MNKNIDLVENKEAREELISHLEVIDKVKAVAFVTEKLVITTEQVANYYEVDKETINKLITRNKEELESNGLKTIRGEELKAFKAKVGDLVPHLKFTSQLCLLDKRALLNVGMLLTDSKVAEKVRDYLLNVEDNSTVEQKVEAVANIAGPTISEEQLINSVNIKLINKKFREERTLLTIQGAIEKLQLYGLTLAEASVVIQEAIVNKVKIEKAILDKVKEIDDLETNMNRGIVREKIAYAAKHYFDDDYEEVYHLMSDKMRYQIGFNMRAERDRLKAKNKKAERGCKEEVPSYLDYIVKYNAYEVAGQAINAIMDEKEAFKALATESRKATVKKNNEAKKAKKSEEIKPKEAKTDTYTF